EPAVADGLRPVGTSSGICPGVPGTQPQFTTLVQFFGRGNGSAQRTDDATGVELTPARVLPFTAQAIRLAGIYVAANCPVAWNINIFLYRPGVDAPQPTGSLPPVNLLVRPGQFEIFFDNTDLHKAGLSGFIAGGGTSVFVSGEEYVAVFDPATG